MDSTYHPAIPHRRSIRLAGYDYAQAGLYFVTVCVKDKECLFGTIENGQMVLNEAGKMVETWYYKLPDKFMDIQCHEIVIMPNHFHCIIENTGNAGNVGADPRVCPGSRKPCLDSEITSDGPDRPDHTDGDGLGEHVGSPLHRVVQWFKTMTTNEYIRGVKTRDWPPFDGRLWQRNYYEHIIRNARSHQQIADYIATNPLRWEQDALRA
jgi:REP element-mobilizing transposase RayT